VLKPAANLQHLDEVLVVTGTSDELPAATQRDLAKSAVAGAEEVEMERASDILAQKLPGIEDPNAPAGSAAGADGLPENVPLKPLTAARPDRFSPGEVPPASQMTPGKPIVIPSSARTSELMGQGGQVKRARKPDSGTDAEGATKTPHTEQESFIIPGTATGPDKPLMGPAMKTSTVVAPATAGVAAPAEPQNREQRQ
jgi:rod shape-determining protein MreC